MIDYLTKLNIKPDESAEHPCSSIISSARSSIIWENNTMKNNNEDIKTIKHYFNQIGVKCEEFTSYDDLTRTFVGYNFFNTNDDVMNNLFISLPNSFTNNIDKELFSDFVVLVGDEMLDNISYERRFENLEDVLGFLLSNKSIK
tara:strand:+ start:108 stop:539 length:432 start_codon:yes stop_codon:yes gene_type:complete